MRLLLVLLVLVTDGQDAPTDEDVRAARIESLDNALGQLKDVDDSDPAKKCLLDQLREARREAREKKPVLQQHTTIAYRLQATEKKNSPRYP